MKTKSEIEMDFNKAVSQADELLRVSSKLTKIVDKSDEALNTLSSGWNGSNSGKFKEKGGVLEKEMLTAADDIKKIAESIKKTAGIIYNAEKIAIQLGF